VHQLPALFFHIVYSSYDYSAYLSYLSGSDIRPWVRSAFRASHLSHDLYENASISLTSKLADETVRLLSFTVRIPSFAPVAHKSEVQVMTPTRIAPHRYSWEQNPELHPFLGVSRSLLSDCSTQPVIKQSRTARDKPCVSHAALAHSIHASSRSCQQSHDDRCSRIHRQPPLWETPSSRNWGCGS